MTERPDAAPGAGVGPRPGTARAALQHRSFRTIYFGAFASNIGTWMQNVVLGAVAYSMTGSALFLAVVYAAQHGPLLVFSVVGGMLADSFDRKKALLALSLQQALFTVILAVVTLADSPNRVALVLVVLCIGVGNALYAPIFSAVVPVLVPRRDMTGAIALNSVQMNASRVIGPVIGSAIYAAFGPSWVFLLNTVSFAAVITVIRRVDFPPAPATGSQGLHRLVEGVRVAQRDRVVGQCLIAIFTFSFLCLPFIPQLPKIAADHLAIEPKSSAYGFLYACFGIGAVLGALSIGSVFAGSSMPTLTRRAMVGFAVMLVVFGSLRSAAPAYVAITGLGAVYFAVITSLSTTLQQDLDDAVRGKVMALWIMGFGGTVPLGGFAGGALIEVAGIVPMVVVGAVMAVGLALALDYLPGEAGPLPATSTTATASLATDGLDGLADP